MDNKRNHLAPNKATKFFIKVLKMYHYTGFPYICVEKDLPPVTKRMKCMTCYEIIGNVIIFIYIILEMGSFFTQHNLTEKQKSDRMIFTLGHPVYFFMILNVFHHNETVRHLLYNMLVVLKETHNDEEVERQAIGKMKWYSAAVLTITVASVILYELEIFVQMIRYDVTFSGTIAIWPDIEDRSAAASFARIVFCVMWIILLMKMCGMYLLMIPTTIYLSHQYKNLQSYFRSLNNIFSENLSQGDKERKYERSLKIGIQFHSLTRWCVRQCQTSFNMLFTSQVVMNMIVLVIVMGKMVNAERTLLNLLGSAFYGAFILTSTGLIMLHAGEVTVQAAELPTAVYCSGWQNCQESARVRQLVVCIMKLGQQPEILSALGVLPFSYESYIKIVKSSYSVFSMLY